MTEHECALRILNEIERLSDKLDAVMSRCFRIENENIALATANSELRTEVRELRALLRSVTHD